MYTLYAKETTVEKQRFWQLGEGGEKKGADAPSQIIDFAIQMADFLCR